MIERALLNAPREQLGVLVEPAPHRLCARSHASAIDGVPMLDASIGDLRHELRRQLGLDESAPLIATGHQAEFYHAGVLAKTIAADALARRDGASVAYLVVDFDTPKNARLAVPQTTAAGPRRVDILIPGLDLRLPVALQPRTPRAHWLDFFERVASTVDSYERTLLRTFVDAWCETDSEQVEFVSAMSRSRRAIEAQLHATGIREIPASELCETTAFRAFAADIVLRAGAFAESYNRAQSAYRTRHRVRNAAVPAPPLHAIDGRIETPFWLLNVGAPRRRLFVEHRGDRVALFADELRLGEVEAARFRSVQTHATAWPELQGWQLRPRALAFSAFARLLLADLFIHGIGGAKYDEMTEDFARAHFGATIAPMACVTATAYPDLPSSGVAPDELENARRAARDVRYNPQRYVNTAAPLLARRESLIHESRRLHVAEHRDHAARRRVFLDLRAANAEILAADPWRPAQLEDRVHMLAQQISLDRISRNREYFFALLPGVTMLSLEQHIRAKFQ